MLLSIWLLIHAGIQVSPYPLRNFVAEPTIPLQLDSRGIVDRSLQTDPLLSKSDGLDEGPVQLKKKKNNHAFFARNTDGILVS